MTIHLPDEAFLQRFTDALRGAHDAAHDAALDYKTNIAVIAVFVGLSLFSSYMSYKTADYASEVKTKIHEGIYNKDGWSMIAGAYANEYTAFTERPDWYARFKQKYPERTHF